jgi:hypothetical protein
MTVPFDYPPVPHVRRHGHRGYAGYESYRPWLRDEFAFRCVYCLTREVWTRFTGTYAIDHFLPVATNPDLETDYGNLLYACIPCNLAKGSSVTPNPLSVLIASGVSVSTDGVAGREGTRGDRSLPPSSHRDRELATRRIASRFHPGRRG